MPYTTRSRSCSKGSCWHSHACVLFFKIESGLQCFNWKGGNTEKTISKWKRRKSLWLWGRCVLFRRRLCHLLAACKQRWWLVRVRSRQGASIYLTYGFLACLTFKCASITIIPLQPSSSLHHKPFNRYKNLLHCQWSRWWFNYVVAPKTKVRDFVTFIPGHFTQFSYWNLLFIYEITHCLWQEKKIENDVFLTVSVTKEFFIFLENQINNIRKFMKYNIVLFRYNMHNFFCDIF